MYNNQVFNTRGSRGQVREVVVHTNSGVHRQAKQALHQITHGVMAGARARQLLAGSTPRVAVGEHKKTTVALQEVITKAVEKVEKEDVVGE